MDSLERHVTDLVLDILNNRFGIREPPNLVKEPLCSMCGAPLTMNLDIYGNENGFYTHSWETCIENFKYRFEKLEKKMEAHHGGSEGA